MRFVDKGRELTILRKEGGPMLSAFGYFEGKGEIISGVCWAIGGRMIILLLLFYGY